MDAPDKRIGQDRNVIEAARAAGVSKVVYTSVQGPGADNSFSPIVLSNRQTEEDVKASGLEWFIGRNGIDIEPDVEYVATNSGASSRTARATGTADTRRGPRSPPRTRGCSRTRRRTTTP